MDLFRAALPGAHVGRREPGQPAGDREPQADYVVLAEPCRTVFDAQPSPKAIFTAARASDICCACRTCRTACPSSASRTPGWRGRWPLRARGGAAIRAADGHATRRSSAQARWEQHRERAPASVRAGVLGLGVIGGAIASALVAQGFAVRGYATPDRRIDGVDASPAATGSPRSCAVSTSS